MYLPYMIGSPYLELIPLPESLRVKRHLKGETELLDKARTWLTNEERAPGLHASDLLDERLAYFQHTDPKPLGDAQVGLFLVGKVLHAFVLGAIAGDVSITSTDAGSSAAGKLGITCSPDYDSDGIAEFKTSRSFYEPKDVEKDLGLYIEQLLIYMVDRGVKDGKIWVLYLNHKVDGRTNPQFRCYSVSISDADYDKLTAYLLERIDVLGTAIRTRQFHSLPLCREWKCGERNCVYWNDCRPEGRYEVSGLAKAKGRKPREVGAVGSKQDEGN